MPATQQNGLDSDYMDDLTVVLPLAHRIKTAVREVVGVPVTHDQAVRIARQLA